MFRSLHIAATGMAAQETQLEGVANNIANANTTGFKRQRIEFQDLLYQTVRGAGTRTSESRCHRRGNVGGADAGFARVLRCESAGRQDDCAHVGIGHRNEWSRVPSWINGGDRDCDGRSKRER